MYQSYEEIKAASLILDEVIVDLNSVPKDCYQLLATSEPTSIGLFENTEYSKIDKVLVRMSRDFCDRKAVPTQKQKVLIKITSLEDISNLEKILVSPLIISVADRTIEIYDDYRE